MSFKESGSDILTKISNRYIKTPAVFNASSVVSTVYSDPTYTGRQFTSGGTLTVTAAGYFTALIIDAGNNGGTATSTLGGAGGAGGNVKVITGYLNTGNYEITIATSGGTATGFTPAPTSTLSTMTFLGGLSGTAYNRPSRTDGGNGPTITIAPFTAVLASGGGGGGNTTYPGAGAVGKTGGAGSSISTVINSATFGGGGGGGGSGTAYRTGGTGGPGYFWIVSQNSSINLSTTNNITNYKINNGNYTLSNLLDNYMAVTYNPNVSMYNIVSTPNISTYLNTYKINGVAMPTYFANNGYRKHPFTITSTSNSSYNCNYYNGYYTLIFTATGTYTIIFSSAISNLVAYVCSAGGSGRSTQTGDVFAAGGGGSGIVTKGTLANIELNGSCTVIHSNTSDSKFTYGSNTLSASKGGVGGSPMLLPTVGTTGTAGTTGTLFTSVSASTGANLITNFGTTSSGYVMYTSTTNAIGFGGAGTKGVGSTPGYGGKYGVLGGNTTDSQGLGYGAGGGGGRDWGGLGGAGGSAVIILSFPYA